MAIARGAVIVDAVDVECLKLAYACGSPDPNPLIFELKLELAEDPAAGSWGGGGQHSAQEQLQICFRSGQPVRKSSTYIRDILNLVRSFSSETNQQNLERILPMKDLDACIPPLLHQLRSSTIV